MIELYGPPLAPPVEYARWMLARMGYRLDFVASAAGLSAIRSARLKVPIEPPLLLLDGAPYGGFRTSLALLHDRLSPIAPHPVAKPDPTFTDDLFATLFGQAVRCFYRDMLQAPKVLKPMSTTGVPAWNRWVVTCAYPLWRRVLAGGLKLNSMDAASDDRSMQQAFARVASRLGDMPYLGGTAPGAEDFLFAVMASPIILPNGHPVPMPDLTALPPAFQVTVERFRALPAGQLAIRIYQHRSVHQKRG